MNVYRCINKYKDDAHDNRKKGVHEIVDEFFCVCSHLGEDAEGFSAALVFKVLVGELHRMLKPIGKDLGPEFLDHHVGKIILHVLGNPAHHGRAHRHQQQGDGGRKKGVPAKGGTIFLLDIDVL